MQIVDRRRQQQIEAIAIAQSPRYAELVAEMKAKGQSVSESHRIRERRRADGCRPAPAWSVAPWRGSHHGLPAQQDRDRCRDREARRASWTVERFPTELLDLEPRAFERQVTGVVDDLRRRPA